MDFVGSVLGVLVMLWLISLEANVYSHLERARITLVSTWIIFFLGFFSGMASYPVTAPCLWDRLGRLQGLGLQVL